MKGKIILLVFALVIIFSLAGARADSQTMDINWVVPDTTAPEFQNLKNHTININDSFSYDLDATDESGIDCFVLNETTEFDIDCSGLITNQTKLTNATLYNLEVTVNDTIGNENTGSFYINVTSPTGAVATIEICRYKKFGYYNTALPWMRQGDCV